MVDPKKKKPVAKKVVKKKAVSKRPAAKRRASAKTKSKKLGPLSLRRSPHNPIIDPAPHSSWESEAVFNPGAVMHGGRVHLFYRALGPDGISRVGYASSQDGVHFDQRHPHPVYMPETTDQSRKHHPYTSPARLVYDTDLYVSGGGWGGCEDPRAVKMDGRVYLTFNMFNGWESLRVGLTSISEEDLEKGEWRWKPLVYLSPPNQRHKNWVLFSEKIGGKFALFHNLFDEDPGRVKIEFLETLDKSPVPFHSPDPQMMPNRVVGWHNRTRSIGPPPLKTSYGWLSFYHAMDKNDPGRYKLGAMLLDLKDPTRVLYRSTYPILEPDEWYENNWKPGIIYVSGAVIKNGTIFLYYGGGDKHIGVATVKLDDFISKLMHNQHAVFSSVKSIKVE